MEDSQEGQPDCVYLYIGYWSCLGPVLVATVDREDGEVALHSLLHLIPMCACKEYSAEVGT